MSTLPAVIVITGMHRSGTSLIASAFQLGGVHIGDRLIGRYDSNRRGHFEDVEFEEFHDRVLGRVGKNHLTATQDDVRKLIPEELEQASTLVARRRERPLWGWKDPTTCLFLDVWHSLLTNPRYVFVYRHPLDVVLSLLRRHMDVEMVDVVTDPLTALDSWVTHNQAMLDFYQRHRTQCVLGHVHALAADLPGALAMCATKFGVELQGEHASTVYHAAELAQRRIPAEILAEFTSLAPLAAMLYRQIEQAADLPQPTVAGVDTSLAGNGTWDGRETLTQQFEVLLTRLDPGAVLSGRRALDEQRRLELEASGGRYQALQAHGRGLEARVAELLAQNTELAARNVGQAAEITGLKARTTELATRDTELTARTAELAAHTIELRSEIALVNRHRAELERRLDDAQRQFVDAATRMAAAEARSAQRADDLAGLRAQHAGVCEREARLELEHARLGWSLADATQSLTAAQAETAAERVRNSEAAAALAIKESRLAAIAQTRVWRLAQKWYAFKRAVRRLLPGAAACR